MSGVKPLGIWRGILHGVGEGMLLLPTPPPGIMPAIITPMDANGDLDEDAFRAVMEYNIQAGVHGFWIAGGTGESVLIEDEENKRMAEIAAELNKGRVTNIM